MGDIMACVEDGQFVPEIWIYSSKVLFKGEDGRARGDPEILLEHQLRESVEKIILKHPKCRVINISFSNLENIMFEGQRQFNLAALLDELCVEYDIVIVVTTGNNENYSQSEYPDYLLNGSNDIKIADPSSSALSLSVGSIFKRRLPNDNTFIDIPSPFTRVGPGYKGMIKPELVEYGGSHDGEGIVTLNPDWLGEGNLFRRTLGTSYSTPRVSNHLAMILNKFNNFSANLVKALLLSSTEIPKERPGNLADITPRSNDKNRMSLYNVYGYGKPDLRKALFSSSNHVLLVRDDTITLNNVKLFTINVPENFINEAGKRNISVTLVFNPPVNKNRSSYMGAILEMHLFKNLTVKKIKDSYGEIKIESESEDVVPQKIRNAEIKLKPGSNIRKRGVHQKATIEYSKKPSMDWHEPLVLAVICRDRGWAEKNHKQAYAIVVTIEHSKEIDLYNQLQLRNRERAQIR